jgi:hypothetical protein
LPRHDRVNDAGEMKKIQSSRAAVVVREGDAHALRKRRAVREVDESQTQVICKEEIAQSNVEHQDSFLVAACNDICRLENPVPSP